MSSNHVRAEPLPFASGLSSEPPAEPHPKGIATLMAIRERAEGDMRRLAPHIVRRFDGEWIEPDAFDIEEHATSRATKYLIDLILGDADLARWFSRCLAGGYRGASQ